MNSYTNLSIFDSIIRNIDNNELFIKLEIM